jgi:hypothetical protein
MESYMYKLASLKAETVKYKKYMHWKTEVITIS